MESDLLELGFGNYVQTSVLFSEYIITLRCAVMGVSLTRTHMNKESGWIKKKKKRYLEMTSSGTIKSDYSSCKTLPQKDTEVN